MKTNHLAILTLSVGLLLIGPSRILGQSVYIPDAAFRTFLETNYPNCMSGGNLDTQCSEVVNETILDVGALGIADLTGAQYFVNLQVLDCASNLLTELVTPLPTTLEDLRCNANDLTQLPTLPNGLVHLRAGGNDLTQLPGLPSSLFNLSVAENNLTSLPSLPINLNTLTCDGNQLTTLPTLPESVSYLECSQNMLVELPDLPNGLISLWAGNNQLDCLPVLPDELSTAVVGGNNLHCIPNKPESLEFSFFNSYALSLPICLPNNIGGCPVYGNVFGTAYYDQNLDCQQAGNNEIGLVNRVVEVTNGEYAMTNESGDYLIRLDPGLYSVWQHTTAFIWSTPCPVVPYSVTLSTSSDYVTEVDFANQIVNYCPWLQVNVSASRHRPCFSTGRFDIQYCNLGTEDETDVYIDLTFPGNIIPSGSSTPWQYLGNGVYRFQIGSLAIEECGTFYVTDSVSCDAQLGETACVTASIFPISPCEDGGPGWDHSSIAVDGNCNGSTVDFVVQNTGSGGMNYSTQYRLFEDDILIDDGQVTALASGQSTIISVNATGMTYRLEVDQSPEHPGVSMPRMIIEGCGPTPYSLGHVLTVGQDDVDDRIDIGCVEFTGSYDPNDKHVVPSGYGAEHLVSATDSVLEYIIRFQNTGSDTAFTVLVVDSLPSDFVNPATFVSGASSHPYTVSIYGNGIVSWKFENILLPDSSTNEVQSHGYVSFKIRTRQGLPVGTVISNSAAIYFDYNDPVITNTASIKIAEPMVTAVNDRSVEGDLLVYPNPTTGMLNLMLSDGPRPSDIRIYDMTGRIMLSEPFKQRLDVSLLKAGNYMLEVRTEEGSFRQKLTIL